ncbi:hypothetical protein [Citrobacter amalonaticus]|uniref:hypothetical protein n=1 Tax=Citrobacter amalonaticus TaxID=35703 RepID=UPI0031F33187
MTESRFLVYLRKIVLITTVGAFCYTIFVISACWPSLHESHQLLTVQWCRNDDSDVYYADSISRHGIYVYLERASGKVMVREMNTPLNSPFQPYRYIYTQIAHADNIRLALTKWGSIVCLQGNQAIIGSSGYVFSWGA